MHLTAHLDIDLVALSAAEELTCLIELTAPTPPGTTARPGQAVVVVLDRSGSMAGAPIEGARRAIADLVRRLAPQDVFGLVTFDSAVDIPVPVTRLAERPLDELITAIEGVHARGTTDLSAGYLMGLREATRALADGTSTSGASASGPAPGALSGATVLLVSDGHANAGIVDPDRLAEVATGSQRGARITTSTLGLGERYDEVILAALARGGSGEHRYAPDVDAATAEFAGLVEDLLGKSVTGALLRVLPQHGLVERIRVHGALPSWPDGDAVTVNLGDLYAGEERHVLVGLHVPALDRLGTASVADLELSYTSLPDLVVHTVNLPVSVNVVPGDEARGRVPDARVSVARLIAEADDVKRHVSERLRAGDTTTAQASLAETIGRVRAARPLAGDDETLGARLEATVDDLVELERSTRERSNEWASKLAMESWNQTARGKRRRTSRLRDEGGQPSGAAGAWQVPGLDGIELVLGDIAHVVRAGGFDAVVNATNPALADDGHGASGALHALAGPELAQACRALAPLSVAHAVATPGFGLQVDHVLHTVGPRYGIDEPSAQLLAATHRSVIELADRIGCTTVALPAISTGEFGYPLEEAAPIALEAVRHALAAASSLRRVTFVLHTEDALRAFRRATIQR
jgi:Ca-activated chloride channel family protein